MCDTMVALPPSTAGRLTLFGKNSDRQRNEAQAVEFYPKSEHEPGALIECTYLTLPQVSKTSAVLLCRPFWTWGAEMGANEHGVVIGNEGLHARSPASEIPALIGMDLVRLTLERACSASEAVQVMTDLLARYGQGGNCGHLTPAYYNNGFIIADSNEAFVLETLAGEWLMERVSTVRSISNAYSIESADRASPGLQAHIRELGWPLEDPPHYARAIKNPSREHIGNAEARRACSTDLLRHAQGELTAADLMAILRDHGDADPADPQWPAAFADHRTLCMHAGAQNRGGQTVGSMVSEISTNRAVHWITGTAAPCISIFKPVILGVPLPQHGPTLTDRYDPRTLWWTHEHLHRRALQGDFPAFLEKIRPERNALEREFSRRIREVLDGGDTADRARVVARCWRDAGVVERSWQAKLTSAGETAHSPYAVAWEDMNRRAGLEGK